MTGKTKAFEVADLTIELNHSQPPISRIIRVPTLIGLHQLHNVIQCLFQWTESHLHAFYIKGEEYQNPDNNFGDDFGSKPKNEKQTKLASLIEWDIGRFSYVYDFGDNWEHAIQIVKIYEVHDPKEMLKLLAGSKAAPPEDIGGIPGYEYLKEVLSDPKHVEYAHMLEWVGDDFDPALFDEKEISIRLENLRIHFSRYWSR